VFADCDLSLWAERLVMAGSHFGALVAADYGGLCV